MDRSVLAKTTRGLLAFLLVIGLFVCMLLTSSCEKKPTQGYESAIAASPSPAFSDDYAVIEQAMLAKGKDAKLLAVKTISPATKKQLPLWGYLFVSRIKVCCYLAYLNPETNEVVIQEYSHASYTQGVMDAIPAASDIPMDADEAYLLVAQQLSDEQQVHNVLAQLTTYDAEAEAQTEDTMCWYFAFNADEDTPRQYDLFTYRVDAVTGEVTQIEIEEW